MVQDSNCVLPKADQAEFPGLSISDCHPDHKQPLQLPRPALTPRPMSAHFTPWPSGYEPSSPLAGGMPGVLQGPGMERGGAGGSPLCPLLAGLAAPGCLVWKVGHGDQGY